MVMDLIAVISLQRALDTPIWNWRQSRILTFGICRVSERHQICDGIYWDGAIVRQTWDQFLLHPVELSTNDEVYHSVSWGIRKMGNGIRRWYIVELFETRMKRVTGCCLILVWILGHEATMVVLSMHCYYICSWLHLRVDLDAEHWKVQFDMAIIFQALRVVIEIEFIYINTMN